jgi:hypothetical protein
MPRISTGHHHPSIVLLIVVVVVVVLLSLVSLSTQKKTATKKKGDVFPMYECTGEEMPDDQCLIRLSSLRPTQVAFGRLAALCKQQDMEDYSSVQDLQQYLNKNPIPIVIGDNGQFYATDHHHLAIALYNSDFEFVYTQQGNERFVPVTIIDNQNGKKSEAQFWQYMQLKNYTYLYDQHGKSITYKQLPQSITQLLNDPFRSLSYLVRKFGGYGKVDIFFQEFIWANYFRYSGGFSSLEKAGDNSNPMIEETQLESIFAQALKMAKSKDASFLPGWDKGEKDKPTCALWKHVAASTKH